MYHGILWMTKLISTGINVVFLTKTRKNIFFAKSFLLTETKVKSNIILGENVALATNLNKIVFLKLKLKQT